MANIVSFKNLFIDSIYRIPDYQRGYAWDKEQLNELWEDLFNIDIQRDAYHFTGIITLSRFTAEDLKKINEEDIRSGDSYDSIKLSRRKKKGYNLVDGQQRITTLLILLSCLIGKLKDKDEKEAQIKTYFYQSEGKKNKYLFGYHIDVPSYNYLIRNVFEDETYDEEETETLYTHNLNAAKEFFIKKLKNKHQKVIKDMIKKITDRLLFSVLDLDESPDKKLDVSMIFETLNFRGKQLSGLERFKNRVLYLLSKQQMDSGLAERRRIMINKTWLEIYKWLGKNPNNPMQDDRFLKAFWILAFSNSTMVAKDFKAYQKNIFEKDFNLQNISANEFMKPNQLPKWLKLMQRAVRVWYLIHNPYNTDEDDEFGYYFSPEIQRSLYRLSGFPMGYGSYMLTLVLAVLLRHLPKTEDNESEVEREDKLKRVENILYAIERHNIMCFLLQGNKTNFNQERTFRDVREYFKSGRTAPGENMERALLNERVEHFDWRDVKRNIIKNENFFSWDGIRFFLREYEESLSGKRLDREVSINLLYPDDQHPQVRVEYPSFHRLHSANKIKYSYSLGNIFISNGSITARPFQSHKTRIKNNLKNKHFVYKSEEELLGYKSWSRDSVLRRGTGILNFVLEKWNIPKPEEEFYRELLAHERLI